MTSPIKSARNLARKRGVFVVCGAIAVVFLALSCLGTKGVKEEKITWRKITASLATGGVLFFFNWWLLDLPLTATANAAF